MHDFSTPIQTPVPAVTVAGTFFARWLLSSHPRRTLPISHYRAGMNRNSPYPPRHAFLSRASTPLAGRASFALCDRRRPVMRGSAGCRAGLTQRSRQDVLPLRSTSARAWKAPLEGGLPGCAAGAVTGQTTRLNGSDHTSINSLWHLY